MAAHKNIFPISKMSKVLAVSRSGYYRWVNRKPSKREVENAHLSDSIKKVWKDSHRRYGSPRIHKQLRRQGLKASRVRVARLMRRMGIASQIRRKWVKTTQSNHSWPVSPNLLNRRFTPNNLSEVWVSDITYIANNNGWLYLTVVMDLADRQIIGWSLSKTMRTTETTLAAFKQACSRRKPLRGMIFHSDRGSQYACKQFTNHLRSRGIIQSMSRKGNCWDNAPVESFFKTLKYELKMQTPFEGYQAARMSIFEFIEIWYNRKRLHSALDYQSPIEIEEQLKRKQAA